jgi:hypothetical protein
MRCTLPHPAGQFRLEPTRDAVMDFMGNLSIRWAFRCFIVSCWGLLLQTAYFPAPPAAT